MRSSLAFSDEKASLNEILLKAKVFLHEIGKKELAEWVKPSFERQTGNWFTKLLGRAAKGGVAVGVDIVTGAVSKALTSY